MKKTDSILREILEIVDPEEKVLLGINRSLNVFIKRLEKKIEKLKINATIFVGGSFAKRTLIKRDVYDIDIFVRFNKKYVKQDISKLTSKILKSIGRVSQLKGSRNYFKIKIGGRLFFEVIPVIEVKTSREAQNITDLSYSHVNYIRRKIKTEKLIDDIKIAKAFCYANQCYGAESYIRGFQATDWNY